MLSAEDTAMLQLRSFVHQRLYAAAEEILGQVEKTITLALYEASDLQRASPGPKADYLQQESVPPETSRAPAEENLLQVTSTYPSIQEESNLCLRVEVSGPSQINAFPENSDGNYCSVETEYNLSKIKQEQEDLGDEVLTQEVSFPDVVKNQQHHPEMQLKYELQPVSSVSSVDHNENSDSSEEWVQRRGAQMMMKKQKVHLFQQPNCSKTKSQPMVQDYKCPDCGRTFVHRQYLAVHMRTHSGEKPYGCGLCGKAFSQRQNLTVHQRLHTGERPYCCEFCGKGFHTRGNLKSHMKHLSRGNPYTCDICGQIFCQKGLLTEHRNAHIEKTICT
ncbi:zinc finger protein 12-like isoform X2 [Sphaeramia orbicularis]|uniref:zinc finger protein 12-like isoform X2 n=1 Tax=Sphaeramia orbicularis TaxID=375764 RepID=UPI00117FA703|nr:zinc finger protein 12-like isoform X2 [Sphaeramia orbicularis]